MIEIDGVVYAENPRPELIRVSYVKPIENYRLFLTFTNGSQRIYDMSRELESGIFKQLKNIELFNSAYVSRGTVVWNDNIDIDPDTLYSLSIPAIEYDKAHI